MKIYSRLKIIVFSLISLGLVFYPSFSAHRQLAKAENNYPPLDKLSLPILMYHHVKPLTGREDQMQIGLTTTDQSFANQLKVLRDNGYQTFFAGEIPDLLAGKMLASQQSVALTFDDGYDDFYNFAFPLLKEYQFKATVYIIYNAINAPGYLTENQIKEMVASGLVEIGSHTLDHVDLKKASSAEARRQIVLSKNQLEARFKIKVKTFAYPFGYFKPETISLVKTTGYTSAVSVIPGDIQTKDNLFSLPRLRPKNLMGEKFKVELLQKYHFQK